MEHTNKSFKTGIKAFDNNYGQYARGGDSWLIFGQSGGGKTNLVCQTAGFTATDGKLVLYITANTLKSAIHKRAFCAVRSIKIKDFDRLAQMRDKNQLNDYRDWLMTWGKNITGYECKSTSVINFEQEYIRILSDFGAQNGRMPDLIVLDQIKDMLPQPFEDYIQKRNAFNMVATVVATKAVELDNVAIVVAMSNSKCNGKTELTENDTAESRTLCDSTVGVIGITSRLENDNRKATVFNNEQYLVVCKSREINLRIMVKRQFDMCRFVGAY